MSRNQLILGQPGAAREQRGRLPNPWSSRQWWQRRMV